MSVKIREILLVSSPYDAFIIEEDESLASRIINEYKGLNLSLPPRVLRAPSAKEALKCLERRRFHMVITMPHLDEMDAFSFGLEIKKLHPKLPVILLAHSPRGIYPLPETRTARELTTSSSGRAIPICFWPWSKMRRTALMWILMPERQGSGS